MTEQKRFSDLVKPQSERATYENVDMPVGKEFLCVDAEFRPSQFGGEYAIVYIELDGQQRRFNTGSKVLCDQLRQTKEEMPFIASIEMRTSQAGRDYYSLA